MALIGKIKTITLKNLALPPKDQKQCLLCVKGERSVTNTPPLRAFMGRLHPPMRGLNDDLIDLRLASLHKQKCHLQLLSASSLSGPSMSFARRHAEEPSGKASIARSA